MRLTELKRSPFFCQTAIVRTYLHGANLLEVNLPTFSKVYTLSSVFFFERRSLLQGTWVCPLLSFNHYNTDMCPPILFGLPAPGGVLPGSNRATPNRLFQLRCFSPQRKTGLSHSHDSCGEQVLKSCCLALTVGCPPKGWPPFSCLFGLSMIFRPIVRSQLDALGVLPPTKARRRSLTFLAFPRNLVSFPLPPLFFFSSLVSLLYTICLPPPYALSPIFVIHFLLFCTCVLCPKNPSPTSLKILSLANAAVTSFNPYCLTWLNYFGFSPSVSVHLFLVQSLFRFSQLFLDIFFFTPLFFCFFCFSFHFPCFID